MDPNTLEQFDNDVGDLCGGNMEDDNDWDDDVLDDSSDGSEEDTSLDSDDT